MTETQAGASARVLTFSPPRCQRTCEGSRLPLTEVRLVGTALQLHSFGAALNQEVPHQLVGDVTCNKRAGEV